MRTAADELGPQVLLNGSGHRQRSLGERRATEAIELWLVGLDLHHDKPDVVRSGQDYAHISNAGTRVATIPRRGEQRHGFRLERVQAHQNRNLLVAHIVPQMTGIVTWFREQPEQFW